MEKEHEKKFEEYDIKKKEVIGNYYLILLQKNYRNDFCVLALKSKKSRLEDKLKEVQRRLEMMDAPQVSKTRELLAVS